MNLARPRPPGHGLYREPVPCQRLRADPERSMSIGRKRSRTDMIRARTDSGTLCSTLRPLQVPAYLNNKGLRDSIKQRRAVVPTLFRPDTQTGDPSNPWQEEPCISVRVLLEMTTKPDAKFNTLWTHSGESSGLGGRGVPGIKSQYSIKGGNGYGGKGRGEYSRGGDARGGDAKARDAQGGYGRGGDGLGEYAIGGHARGGQATGLASTGGHGEGGHGVAANSRGGDGNGGDALGQESQGGLGRGGHGFGWDTLGGSGFGGEAFGVGAAGGVGEGADGYSEEADTGQNEDGGLVLGGRGVGEGNLLDLRCRRLATIQPPLRIEQDLL